MNMHFNTAISLKNLLFKGLNTDSIKDIALVSVIAFIATVVFSALQAAKEIVVAKRKMNPLARSQQDLDSYSLSVESTGSQNELLSSLRIPTNVGVVRRHKFHLFALESLIHTVKFFYGYLLMLLVMTYNVWLGMAVVLGSGVGYFLFHPLSAHICSLYSQPPISKRQCCDDEGSKESVNHDRNSNSVLRQSHQVSGLSASSATISHDDGQSEPLIHPIPYHHPYNTPPQKL